MVSVSLNHADTAAGELKDGTAEFKDKTSDIDQQIDDEIDEMLSKISGSKVNDFRDGRDDPGKKVKKI